MAANYRTTTGSIAAMNRWKNDSNRARRQAREVVETPEARAAHIAALKKEIAQADIAAGRKVWLGAR
jgi:hypothetical protein